MLFSSIAGKCAALIVAISLPAAKTSIYFYQSKSKTIGVVSESDNQKTEDNELDYSSRVEIDRKSQAAEEQEELVKFSWINAKSLLWSHFKSGYSNNTVLLWSLWWALLQTGFRMVYTYNQPLWAFIEPDREDIYNGFAESGLTLFGALGALLAGKLNQQFIEKWAIVIVVVCCLGQGTFAILAGRTTSVFLSYAMYIAVGVVYYFMVTVCSAIVAKNLVQDSFGLIFGINTWFALLFTFVFTFVVVSGTFFSLNPGEQYTIYGCYFFVLAIAFAFYGIVKGRKKNKGSLE